MNAIGIVFLYDRKLGSPEEMAGNFKDNFSQVTENLVSEGLLDLPELKKIIDSQKIYWAGVRENFAEVLGDSDTIGKISWITFKNHTNIEAGDDNLHHGGTLSLQVYCMNKFLIFNQYFVYISFKTGINWIFIKFFQKKE